ncbi:hypothetical protein CLU95_5806 [Variovorax sp. 54]|uniref:hypothetical protein n=1 Tax=Variovorax sp. 54 TaxID=2035212 RepID=UPI000C17E9FE|nr:hypothetical protein [Variovorax sp. 54]PIF78612.1 hypothetical protein CLU95_5806 [Variovorax sp. 54]
MSALNDLALTVEETEPGRFHWVLLKAGDNGDADALDYRVHRRAVRAEGSYSNALAMGVAQLQKLSAKASPDIGD